MEEKGSFSDGVLLLSKRSLGDQKFIISLKSGQNKKLLVKNLSKQHYHLSNTCEGRRTYSFLAIRMIENL